MLKMLKILETHNTKASGQVYISGEELKRQLIKQLTPFDEDIFNSICFQSSFVIGEGPAIEQATIIQDALIAALDAEPIGEEIRLNPLFNPNTTLDELHQAMSETTSDDASVIRGITDPDCPLNNDTMVYMAIDAEMDNGHIVARAVFDSFQLPEWKEISDHLLKNKTLGVIQ